MMVYLASLTSDRAPSSYGLGLVCHSKYSFLSLDQVTHQEKKIIYLDCLSIKTAISSPVKGLLGRMNSNFLKQWSFRNNSRILPQRSVWSNRATERHWVLQDHSRGKPLQLHPNLVGTYNDSWNICSQLQVRLIHILRCFGVLHRDQLSSMQSLLNQRAPGVSVLFLLTYAFHRSITHRLRSKDAFFAVRLQFLPRIF